mmetsp:Transcript_15002/g.23057  ORF Transcript_15002/g.23057 Transcript_15002/m.23057 type:complete len:199 (+) Transcript_15002:144-740(+)|eukprot:CAMPEP_0194221318 /NCGR_PEP_ID=MMETSP0156-20130528/30365_1 /TAXON_ID=33649 /ORGANISM="Thalassionema nitzschioides, Strain L26-B" /LENGTH=198 /DNA_ID=CAMNT_0038951685 /DNA_START=56 /DNA_END=652 /DNA_ORIENTATION=-
MSRTRSKDEDPQMKREISELTETILASLADVGADWTFFFMVMDDEAFKAAEAYDALRLSLFVVCVLSSIFAAVLFVSSVIKMLGWISADTFKKILVAEALIGDVPDFVVTSLIELARGEGITTIGVLSIVTSAYNLIQNALAYFRIEDNSARRLRSNSSSPADQFEERYSKRYDTTSAREKLDKLKKRNFFDEEEAST